MVEGSQVKFRAHERDNKRSLSDQVTLCWLPGLTISLEKVNLRADRSILSALGLWWWCQWGLGSSGDAMVAPLISTSPQGGAPWPGQITLGSGRRLGLRGWMWVMWVTTHCSAGSWQARCPIAQLPSQYQLPIKRNLCLWDMSVIESCNCSNVCKSRSM